MQNSIKDTVQKEKYGKLLSYFKNNKDALISYKRRGIELPPAPAGKEYRQCGTAESNIYSVLARRMKGCRACWSIRGGEHLAKLLTLYATNRLQDTVEPARRIGIKNITSLVEIRPDVRYNQGRKIWV